MKKIKVLVLSVVMALCAFFCVACGESGTYKFESAKATAGALTVEYKVGDKFLGTTLTEDFCVVELKGDNTVSYKYSSEATLNGTWAKSETVKKGYVLSFGSVTIPVVIEGKTMTFEYLGMSFVLSK